MSEQSLKLRLPVSKVSLVKVGDVSETADVELVTLPKADLQEVRQSRYEDGYSAGHAAGLSDGRSEAKPAVQRFESMVNEATKTRDDFLGRAEVFVVDLGVKIARKIIDRELEIDKSLIERVISGVLRDVSANEPVTVRVHPDDFVLLRGEKIKALSGNGTDVDNIKMVPDPSVEYGGCVLDTEWGRIDAQLSVQLEAVHAALSNMEKLDDLDVAA